jgi:hypothetical protein
LAPGIAYLLFNFLVLIFSGRHKLEPAR